MNIHIENCTNLLMYTNILVVFTLLHTHKQISDYIQTEKLIRTNVRINICDQYIWIFKYIRHTLPKTYSCYTIRFWPKFGLILFMHKNIRYINVLHLGKKYFMILGVYSLFQTKLKLRLLFKICSLFWNFKIYKRKTFFIVTSGVFGVSRESCDSHESGDPSECVHSS